MPTLCLEYANSMPALCLWEKTELGTSDQNRFCLLTALLPSMSGVSLKAGYKHIAYLGNLNRPLGE